MIFKINVEKRETASIRTFLFSNNVPHSFILSKYNQYG